MVPSAISSFFFSFTWWFATCPRSCKNRADMAPLDFQLRATLGIPPVLLLRFAQAQAKNSMVVVEDILERCEPAIMIERAVRMTP